MFQILLSIRKLHFGILDFNMFCQTTLSGHNILPYITFYKYLILIIVIFQLHSFVYDQEKNSKTID